MPVFVPRNEFGYANCSICINRAKNRRPYNIPSLARSPGPGTVDLQQTAYICPPAAQNDDIS